MVQLIGLLILHLSATIYTSQLIVQTMSEEMFIQLPNFTAPLDDTLYISGNFGEPRPNHYHAGLDLKTDKQIGKKVYAADAGYISRIKVSPYGYGHALYMNHPSGLTTVYAHLDEFIGPISEWVKSLQYKLESFDVDTILDENIFSFQRGEQIAFSGNTGGSSGPHLHFEIRDTYSEVTINPMAYLKVKDHTPPAVQQLNIYPIQNSFFDHSGIPVTLKASSVDTWSAGSIQVPEGNVIFALQAYDQQDLTPKNKNGIPTIKMFVDGQLAFLRQQDSIDFSKTKYAHAMVDYFQKAKNGVDFYLTTLLPGNLETGPYVKSPTTGRIKIKAGETKKIEIQLIDFHQNTTKVTFEIKGVQQQVDSIIYLSKQLNAGKKELEGASIYWKEQSFYDLIPDKISVSTSNKSSFSKTYNIFQKEAYPIHKSLKLVIHEWNAPKHLHDKLILVGENTNNKKKVFPVAFKGENITASISEAALVYLDVDTVAPKVQLVNYQKNSRSFSEDKILVKITDQLSGIQSYNGYIDGQWVLFNYDAKNDLLEHHLDKNLIGEHELLIKVVDRTNNITEQTVSFKK